MFKFLSFFKQPCYLYFSFSLSLSLLPQSKAGICVYSINMPGNICTPFDRRRTNGNHLKAEELPSPLLSNSSQVCRQRCFPPTDMVSTILARLNYDLLLLVSHCLSYSSLPSCFPYPSLYSSHLSVSFLADAEKHRFLLSSSGRRGV